MPRRNNAADVRPARETVVRHISAETAEDSLRWDREQERPFYTRGFARSTPLQHAVRWRSTEEPAPAYPPAAPLNEISSDTGELTWRHADAKHGLVTVDTPRAQGLIGFVGREWDRLPACRESGQGRQAGSLSHLRAAVDNDFCALLCTSLDDRPIAESARLLLAATARVENSGMKWEADGRTLANWGQLPMAIEPVIGTVTLAGLQPAKSVVACPLTAAGVPQDARIPTHQANNDWSFPVGSPHVATWYLIEVRR